jgi:hypothetical protein
LQVWGVPAAGDEDAVYQLTDLPLDVENLRWSPTGSCSSPLLALAGLMVLLLFLHHRRVSLVLDERVRGLPG